MIGEVLGSYTIERKLGEGGMGEVFLATHRRISKRAAVKVLLPDFSREPEILNRFFNEARTTSLIEHPNIVEILDCDVHASGRAFIVMEYLHGEGLSAALRRAGSLAGDLGAVLGMMSQITGAVGAAHAKGIVHRDLKPDNIFLLAARTPGTPPLVKILDFGIAKLAAGGAAGTKTRTGSLLGTPLYMSPEQCRGAQQVDHRADIYSLGCVLYEMLAGRPPFIRDGAGDLIIAHVIEPPQAPSALGVSIPPALEQLVLHMLAKPPEQRPQSMIEVGAQIAAIAAAVGQPPARLTVEEPPALPVAPAVAITPAVITPPVFPAPPRAMAPGAVAAIAGGTARLPSVPEEEPPPARRARTPPPAASSNAGGDANQTTFSRAAGEVASRAPRARSNANANAGAGAPAPARKRTGLWIGIGGAGAVAVAVAVGALAFRGPSGSTDAPARSAQPAPEGEAAPATAAPATKTAPTAAAKTEPTPAPTAMKAEPAPAAAAAAKPEPSAAAATRPEPAAVAAKPEPAAAAARPEPAAAAAKPATKPEPAAPAAKRAPEPPAEEPAATARHETEPPSKPVKIATKPEPRPVAIAAEPPHAAKKKKAGASPSRPAAPGGRKLPAPITDIE